MSENVLVADHWFLKIDSCCLRKAGGRTHITLLLPVVSRLLSALLAHLSSKHQQVWAACCINTLKCTTFPQHLWRQTGRQLAVHVERHAVHTKLPAQRLTAKAEAAVAAAERPAGDAGAAAAATNCKLILRRPRLGAATMLLLPVAAGSAC